MNDKTEELRDIFTDVTDGEETVTESQENTRGSLERDERSDEDRLESVVQQMRERYEFETSLSDNELITVARAFYDDRSDDEVADELGLTRTRSSRHDCRCTSSARPMRTRSTSRRSVTARRTTRRWPTSTT